MQTETVVPLFPDYETRCKALEQVIAWCLLKMGCNGPDNVVIRYEQDHHLVVARVNPNNCPQFAAGVTGTLDNYEARYACLHAIALDLTYRAGRAIDQVSEVFRGAREAAAEQATAVVAA